jgi:hypothetical protein
MPNINRTPAALLRKADHKAVADGDILPGPADWQVRLRGSLPDQDGLVTVESVYRVRPGEVGLYVRPGSVTIEMTDAEAGEASVAGTVYSSLSLFQRKSGTAPAVTRPEAAAPEPETDEEPLEEAVPEPPGPFTRLGKRGGRGSTG